MKLQNLFYDEALLLKQLQHPDTLNIAVQALYRKFYGLLEKMVLSNKGNFQDAEDVIQEAMLVFVKMIRDGNFRAESGLKTVLFSIAKNIWLQKLRSKSAEDNRHQVWTNENIAASSFHDMAHNYQAVIEVFGKLGEVCQKILRLYYFEEKPFDEILEEVDFQNEQSLRNKKSKCMKGLTDLVASNHQLAQWLKNTLRS